MSTMREASEAISQMDIVGAMREAFGRCPRCNHDLIGGHWLKWCSDQVCGWVGPK